jgi:hypothetical protein
MTTSPPLPSQVGFVIFHRLRRQYAPRVF